MIKGVFPRLFGNFREGGLLHAKFVVGGNGGTTATFTLKSTLGNANYGGITMVRGGVGIVTVTVTGGVRNLALIDVRRVIVAAADATASYTTLTPRAAFVESTGVISLRFLDNADTAGGELAFTAGDEVHITLYVDK